MRTPDLIYSEFITFYGALNFVDFMGQLNVYKFQIFVKWLKTKSTYLFNF